MNGEIRMRLDDKITKMKGIGEKTAGILRKLAIETVGDLLHYYPKEYETYTAPRNIGDLKEGEVSVIRAVISREPVILLGGAKRKLSVPVRDQSGGILLTWFHQPYLKKTLTVGKTFLFRGLVSIKAGNLTMVQPKILKEEEYQELLGRMQPLYGLVKGISNQGLAKMVKQAFLHACIKEYLEPEWLERYELSGYCEALLEIHFPTSAGALLRARKRLVFDEFFLFLLAVRKLRKKEAAVCRDFQMKPQREVGELIKNLPYQLTGAQERVWQEIEKDMLGERVMNRLIQGDVGSGKTILAALALLLTACNGCQGALMAPTEVLARQHYDSLNKLFLGFRQKVSLVLLTGSMKAKERREAYAQIESGAAAIIIGTHALIQEQVHYQKLALVVTDEQHRFGVRQRETFSFKGSNPHVLVMSATPIPRTLAIIIYGDLDISVIDELPAARLPIKNCVVDQSYRKTAYRFIEKEVEKGRQVYVICPMIEESEGLEVENVLDYTKLLKSILPKSIRVACLHGRMKPEEKNQIMASFAAQQIQVLVSTTVIEVGVNVPNASVMLVENAERFGLAQLHQLRGRVGRGEHQSYCIFMSGNKNKQTMERLSILNRSNDGFHIASEDMKQRGPGDLFGFRQSGMLNFKIGDIFTDAAILKMANELAAELEKGDLLPGLAELSLKLSAYSHGQLENISL